MTSLISYNSGRHRTSSQHHCHTECAVQTIITKVSFYAMESYGGVKEQLHLFLISTPVGSNLQPSSTSPFPLWQTAPDNH